MLYVLIALLSALDTVSDVGVVLRAYQDDRVALALGEGYDGDKNTDTLRLALTIVLAFALTKELCKGVFALSLLVYKADESPPPVETVLFAHNSPFILFPAACTRGIHYMLANSRSSRYATIADVFCEDLPMFILQSLWIYSYWYLDTATIVSLTSSSIGLTLAAYNLFAGGNASAVDPYEDMEDFISRCKDKPDRSCCSKPKVHCRPLGLFVACLVLAATSYVVLEHLPRTKPPQDPPLILCQALEDADWIVPMIERFKLNPAKTLIIDQECPPAVAAMVDVWAGTLTVVGSALLTQLQEVGSLHVEQPRSVNATYSIYVPVIRDSLTISQNRLPVTVYSNVSSLLSVALINPLSSVILPFLDSVGDFNITNAEAGINASFLAADTIRLIGCQSDTMFSSLTALSTLHISSSTSTVSLPRLSTIQGISLSAYAGNLSVALLSSIASMEVGGLSGTATLTLSGPYLTTVGTLMLIDNNAQDDFIKGLSPLVRVTELHFADDNSQGSWDVQFSVTTLSVTQGSRAATTTLLLRFHNSTPAMSLNVKARPSFQLDIDYVPKLTLRTSVLDVYNPVEHIARIGELSLICDSTSSRINVGSETHPLVLGPPSGPQLENNILVCGSVMYIYVVRLENQHYSFTFTNDGSLHLPLLTSVDASLTFRDGSADHLEGIEVYASALTTVSGTLTIEGRTYLTEYRTFDMSSLTQVVGSFVMNSVRYERSQFLVGALATVTGDLVFRETDMGVFFPSSLMGRTSQIYVGGKLSLIECSVTIVRGCSRIHANGIHVESMRMETAEGLENAYTSGKCYFKNRNCRATCWLAWSRWCYMCTCGQSRSWCQSRTSNKCGSRTYYP